MVVELGMILRIASINCRGLNKKLKRKTIFRHCLSFDIICLQETYVTEKKAREWELEWKGNFYFSEGTNKSKGQIVLVHNRVKCEDLKVFIETDRVLGLNFSINNVSFQVLNVYGPVIENEKPKFIDQLYAIFRNINVDNTILCGDFNIVHDDDLDIIAGKKHDAEMNNRFKGWVTNCMLVDTWRSTHGDEKDFTWSRRIPFTARRLDYIFCNEEFFPQVVESRHETIYGTDRKGIITVFRTDTFKRGPSFWKFNNSLLYDKEFVAIMNECIDNFLESSSDDTDLVERWELLKVTVKAKSIEYSVKRSKEMRYKENLLENEINTLYKQVIRSPGDEIALEQLAKKRAEFEIVQMSKTRGAQVRSRSRWIEEGEKNTKYFLNLEKFRGNANTLTSVRSAENGVLLQNNIDILDDIKKHFESLFKRDDSIGEVEQGVTNFLQGIDHPILSDEDQEACDTPLTLQELDNVTKTLNNESAPGIDGLTAHFYKFFWKKLRLPLFHCIQQSCQDGFLAATQRRGVITLLHKGNNLSRENIKNWRPITLTNTDYKIISKILASRLQNVLPNIISHNQSGFLKGRLIAEHIRTLDDIIFIASECHVPGMIVSLDYQRAFDTIEKETILAALRQFNFGENFINLIKTILSHTESCVQNGGWLSGWFDTERGVKQGCSTSPQLFILVAEIMAIKIRANEDIKGITIQRGGTTTNLGKILQYADDTTLLLKEHGDLLVALRDIENFSKISGLKLNKRKSKGMWVGSSKFNIQTPGDISWVQYGEKIKILGIFLVPRQRLQK